MLRRDTKGLFRSHGVGFWNRKLQWQFSSGKLQTVHGYDDAAYQAMKASQQTTPVLVMHDPQSNRRWWWFKNAFYTDDDGLSGNDVLALILEKQTTAKRRVDRALSRIQQAAVNPADSHQPGSPAPPHTIPDRWAPKTLSEFVGQGAARENLAVFVAAARGRSEPLDHVLLTGPPGIGKRTLASVLAAEIGAGLRVASVGELGRASDLAKILTNLQPKDVLFVDEIHRLSPAVEGMLYPAMEDFRLDITIGEGPMARTIKLDLSPFTLIGATTRPATLSERLVSRFPIHTRLVPYDVDSLSKIVMQTSVGLGIRLSPEAARAIASRSAGNPGTATQLLPRLADFATVAGKEVIDAELALSALDKLGAPIGTGIDTQQRERISEEVRFAVWRRDQGRCSVCGSQERLEFDHIIPVIEGGSSTERNVQLLCESCNRSKGKRI